MKTRTIPYNQILHYLLYFAMMIVSAMAKGGPIRPFGVGVFVGLVYCRKNIWLLAPMLLAAALVGEFSWQSILLAGTTVTTVTIAYYVHYLVKKPLRMGHMLVYTFLSQVPVLFVYGVDVTHLVAGAVGLLLCTCFSLCCMVLAHLVYVKGLRYRLTSGEELAFGGAVAVAAMGLMRLGIGDVLPGYVVLGFVYVLAPRVLKEKGVFVCILAGLGAWAATRNVSALAMAALWGVASYLLRTRHPLFVWVVVTVSDAAAGWGLGLYAAYHYANTLLLAGGALTACLIPRKVRDRWEQYREGQDDVGVRYLVNRNRLDLYTKLAGISNVLTDMRLVLEGGICNMPPLANNKNRLAKELSQAMCSDCARRTQCEHALSSGTAVAMYDLIGRALELGRLNVLEMPSFFGEHCPYAKQVADACGAMLDDYMERKEVADRVDDNKRVMCEQLSGLSGMMADMAKEVKQVVSFDTTRETRILEELSNRNVIAKESIIYHNKGLCTAVLVVRAADSEKPDIARILDKHLGKMVRKSVTNHSGGWVSQCYVSAPPLGLASGQFCATKRGSERSGDTFSVLPLSTEKVLLAVCDGMGSGVEAAGGANAAMALVESFYTAGVDDGVVLDLINKLLAVRNEECFQALDMCVVNLREGHADFIKLGAPESVIRHTDRIQVVEGGALPLGILENVTPKVSRVPIGAGDMIIMCSDGISETIGVDGVVRMAEQNPTTNPKTLARLTVEDALFVSEDDDKTVLCARIYDNV